MGRAGANTRAPRDGEEVMVSCWCEKDFVNYPSDYWDAHPSERAPATFLNDVAAIVQRNMGGRHVLLSQRYGIAQGVWDYIRNEPPSARSPKVNAESEET